MKHQLVQQIASKLKQLRNDKGWSLDKTANMTGVSKAMLGQIERAESTPTIVILWKIAVGFNVSFSMFIADPRVSGTAEQPKQISSIDGLDLCVLVPYKDDVAMEVYQMTLAANCEHRSTAHSSGVVEHIIMISGAMDIWTNNQWHQVTVGQSFRFDASTDHVYANACNEVCVAHCIINYTTTRKHANEQ